MKMKTGSTGSAIYREYLKHPLWQRLRIEILERDHFRCKKCGKQIGSTSLEVHHIEYAPGRKPWEYPKDKLVSLCRNCHELLHFLIENGGDINDYLG